MHHARRRDRSGRRGAVRDARGGVLTVALVVLAAGLAILGTIQLFDGGREALGARGRVTRTWLRLLPVGGGARLRDRRAAVPGLIDALAAALASGLSLQLALAEIAPTLPPALAAPTRRVAASLRLGLALDEALRAYRGVVPDDDLAPLAIVLGSFARAGGPIVRSLARVARLLRGQLALEDERAALTAQGRLSAIVLVSLAPLGMAFFAVATSDYLGTLFGQGRALLAAALVLEATAALWLWRLLRIARGEAAFASLLDAIVVGLEAGMTFQQALAALIPRAPRLARSSEARRLLADLALGRGPRVALAAFGASGAAEARIAALVEAASRFGAPLADLLVVQSDALREAERRRAEAAARRLPVLMLFPLTFCVLPALLIVFLGPPLLSVGR